MAPDGTVTTVLPPGAICVTFWMVVPSPGSVSSWKGLTTFTTVLPSWTAAVLSTVRLEASGWISTVPGKVEPAEASTVYPPSNGEAGELAVGGWDGLFPSTEGGRAETTLPRGRLASWETGTPGVTASCAGCDRTWEVMAAGPEVALVSLGRFKGAGTETGVRVIRTLLRCCDLCFSSFARLRCSSHCCSRAGKRRGLAQPGPRTSFPGTTAMPGGAAASPTVACTSFNTNPTFLYRKKTRWQW